MKKMMIQNVSFVPGFSGGCTLPSFFDLTASKQASKQAFIINKGLLLPEQIVSGRSFFFKSFLSGKIVLHYRGESCIFVFPADQSSCALSSSIYFTNSLEFRINAEIRGCLRFA